jgi:hypothetical protein
MSESGEAETRSQPRERGEAQDRRSRPRARVMADTRRQQQTFVVNEAIGDSRLRRADTANDHCSHRCKEAEA